MCCGGVWDQGGIGAGTAEPWAGSRSQQMSLQPSVTSLALPAPGDLPGPGWGGTGFSSPVIPQGGGKGSVCTPGIAGWGDAPALGPGAIRVWKKE